MSGERFGGCSCDILRIVRVRLDVGLNFVWELKLKMRFDLLA